jgi:rhodanese-related sulfurtransferase
VALAALPIPPPPLELAEARRERNDLQKQLRILCCSTGHSSSAAAIVVLTNWVHNVTFEGFDAPVLDSRRAWVSDLRGGDPHKIVPMVYVGAENSCAGQTIPRTS